MTASRLVYHFTNSFTTHLATYEVVTETPKQYSLVNTVTKRPRRLNKSMLNGASWNGEFWTFDKGAMIKHVSDQLVKFEKDVLAKRSRFGKVLGMLGDV